MIRRIPRAAVWLRVTRTHPTVTGARRRRFHVRRLGRRSVVLLRWCTSLAHRSYVRVNGESAVRVLLVASNPLMSEYVGLAAESFEGNDVRAAFLRLDVDEMPGSCPARGTEIPHVGRVALWQWWDLRIQAEHLPLTFPPTGRTVRLRHGVAMAKRTPGGHPVYDSRMLFEWHKPRYARIFDSSEESASWGRRTFPSLASRIRVVGDVRTDRLVAAAAQFPDRRTDAPICIGFMSTWGKSSLLEGLGPDLFLEIRKLAASEDFRCIVFTHPNLWKRDMSSRDWATDLDDLDGDGCKVVRPGEMWENLLAEVDVAVSDHTSLCAMFAALGRPILPVAPSLLAVSAECAYRRLTTEVEPLADVSTLEKRLIELIEVGAAPAVKAMADEAVSFVGHADERIRDELLEVLDELKRSSPPVGHANGPQNTRGVEG